MSDAPNLPKAPPPTAAAKQAFGERIGAASDARRRWGDKWRARRDRNWR